MENIRTYLNDCCHIDSKGVFYPVIDRRRKSAKHLISVLGAKKFLDTIENYCYKRTLRHKWRDYKLPNREFIRLVKNSTLFLDAQSSRSNTTGIDWPAYVRPSKTSPGAWVFISPDEPCNNVFILPGTLHARFLNRKYPLI